MKDETMKRNLDDFLEHVLENSAAIKDFMEWLLEEQERRHYILSDLECDLVIDVLYAALGRGSDDRLQALLWDVRRNQAATLATERLRQVN
jgi:hypothetical protein